MKRKLLTTFGKKGSVSSEPTAAMGYRARWPVLDSTYCFSDAGTTPCVNSDPCQQWNESLGIVASSNLSQATEGNRPVFTTGGAGGQAYLLFDGAGDTITTATTIENYMAVGASTVTMALTIPTGYTAGGIVIRDASGWWFIRHNASNILQMQVFSGASKYATVTFTPDTPFVVSFRHDGVNLESKKDSGAWTTGDACGNRGGSTAFQMNNGVGDAQVYDVSLANVVVPDSDVTAVHNYLMSLLGV